MFEFSIPHESHEGFQPLPRTELLASRRPNGSSKSTKTARPGAVRDGGGEGVHVTGPSIGGACAHATSTNEKTIANAHHTTERSRDIQTSAAPEHGVEPERV
jgi:hypothetical protein